MTDATDRYPFCEKCRCYHRHGTHRHGSLGAWGGVLLVILSGIVVLAFGSSLLQGAEPRKSRPVLIQAQLDLIADRHATSQGVLVNGRIVLQLERPDGIAWANAYSRGYGLVWPAPGNVALGATSSVEECSEETDDLCEQAGHGGSSGAELTDTAQGGCTCSADCDQHDAVAFVSSSSPCGE